MKASSGTLEKPAVTKVAAMTPPTVKRPSVKAPVPRKIKTQNSETIANQATAKPKKVAINVKRPKVERAFEEVETRSPVVRKAAPANWNEEFNFGSGSNKLNDKASRLLRANVRWLNQNPSVTITIQGHTDAIGDEEANMRLGQRRADAAKAFMVRKGIDSSRIETSSMGEQNTKYESNRKNRRIEFIKN